MRSTALAGGWGALERRPHEQRNAFGPDRLVPLRFGLASTSLKSSRASRTRLSPNDGLKSSDTGAQKPHDLNPCHSKSESHHHGQRCEDAHGPKGERLGHGRRGLTLHRSGIEPRHVWARQERRW